MKIDKAQAKVGDWRVDVIESERGWGSHVEDVFYFTEQAEAAVWVKEYNEKWNPPGPVPDWYMAAMAPVQVR